MAGGGAIARPGLERLAASRLSLTQALAAPTGQQPLLTEGDVLDVASDFGDPALGDGLARVTNALGAPALTATQVKWLGDSGQVLGLDRVCRSLPDDALPNFVSRLRAAVTASNADDLAALINGVD